MKDGWFILLVNEKTGVDIVPNHAELRMITRRVLKAFLQFQETNLFIRATFPIFGIPSCVAYFDRPDRVAGKTKYPLKYTLTHKKNCPRLGVHFKPYITVTNVPLFWSCLSKEVIRNY